MTWIELLKVIGVLIAAGSTLIGLVIVIWRVPKWIARIESKFDLVDMKFESIKESMRTGTQHFEKIDRDVLKLGNDVAHIQGSLDTLATITKNYNRQP